MENGVTVLVRSISPDSSEFPEQFYVNTSVDRVREMISALFTKFKLKLQECKPGVFESVSGDGFTSVAILEFFNSQEGIDAVRNHGKSWEENPEFTVVLQV